MSLRRPDRKQCPAMIALSRAVARRPRHPAAPDEPKDPSETQANGRVKWFQPLVGLVVAGLIALAFVLGSALSTTNEEATDAQQYAKVNRALIKRVDDVSKRADQEIVKARLAGTLGSCKQFNDIQIALSRLIRVSLRAGASTPDSSLNKHRRAARGTFTNQLRALRPNDCKAQQDALRRALAKEGYEAYVPFQPSYPER
jgi:hypothetical protein